MAMQFNQRPNDIFLSHASRDKNVFVDKLYDWLTQHAGYKVWFDRGLASGFVSSGLNEAIDTCRGAIIVLSYNAVSSHWVNAECARIHQEWADCKGDFRIATLRLDPVDAPGLLQSFKHIDVPNGELTPEAASLLIETLNGGRDVALGKPVYLCRGWRESERVAAEKISGRLKGAGLKLVCDWIDKPHYSAPRVRDLMDSTGGLAAILPHRGQGTTSTYILREIEEARALGLPTLVFAHESVALKQGTESAIRYDDRIAAVDEGELDVRFGEHIETLAFGWKKPARGEHVFLGHSLEESVKNRFAMLRRMISRLTGLPIETGGEVKGGDEAPPEIVRLIRDAELCIIDITNTTHPGLPEKIDFALNSCIEAGIAMGTGKSRNLAITCAAPRRSPPFMFRNRQVWYYADELELIGRLRQIAMEHRRMVL